jgi:excinuclease UvrABC ATPase subunit
VVVAGTPEQVARSKKSYTAEALRKVLRATSVPASASLN